MQLFQARWCTYGLLFLLFLVILFERGLLEEANFDINLTMTKKNSNQVFPWSHRYIDPAYSEMDKLFFSATNGRVDKSISMQYMDGPNIREPTGRR